MLRRIRPEKREPLSACSLNRPLWLWGVVLLLLYATTGGCQHRAPSAASPASSRSDLFHYGKPLSRLLDLSRGKRDAVTLRIEKSRYRLIVQVNGRAIKAYPVVFGGNPIEDKRREGDRCTPEGTFRIRDRYPHKAWSKFLWLDYPTKDSWRKFRAAKRRGDISPQATIGGEIGIHGVPAGQDSLIETRANWTLGCISLKTADIAEIYSLVKVGTRVKIVP